MLKDAFILLFSLSFLQIFQTYYRCQSVLVVHMPNQLDTFVFTSVKNKLSSCFSFMALVFFDVLMAKMFTAKCCPSSQALKHRAP